MVNEGSDYNIGVIRQLLLEAFTAEDLKRFCQDRHIFRPIIDRFGSVQGLDDRVDEVIDYCEKNLLWEALLDAVLIAVPKQYARFAHGLRHESKQASTLLPSCPYRGLLAFREEDVRFFHGREIPTNLLVKTVLGRPPVAVVIGPSGSGKSSLVFAGLVPRMRRDATHGVLTRVNWLVAHCRPGDRPFHESARALLPLLKPDMTGAHRARETLKIAEGLQDGSQKLHLLIRRIMRRSSGDSHLLLIIDQLEELYTLSSDPAIRHSFIDVLIAALVHQSVRSLPTFTLVLVVRADFLGQVLSYRPLADALANAETTMLGPMNREELRAAVVIPAEKQGVVFETGLADRILEDVGNEPGNLPLLEFALTLLWDRQDSGKLTHEAYEALGKVQGALTGYADQVYASLTPEDQEHTRRIMVQLVHPGEGTEDTRRRATQAELGELKWKLVQELANSRLLVTGQDPVGQPIVEVVHEALIRGWKRLRIWMNEDRDFRIWQDQVRDSMRRWDSWERNPKARLSELLLDEAERWLPGRSDDLGQSEKEFIQFSREWQAQEDQRWQQQLNEISQLQAEVVYSKQLAALGTVMAALQHRISNTLNIIVPNLARLRKRVDMTDETVAEIIEIIERNTRYTADLIWRIQQPLRDTEILLVDVNAVLSEVLRTVQEQRLPDGPQIEVSVTLQDSIPLIKGPLGQIAEVLHNLIDNAFRVMPLGGRLNVTTDSVEDGVRVRIQDTGPGIPQSIQQRLFSQPVSAAGLRSSGLGLWISNLVMQSLGGTIAVESSSSEGTSMLVVLPVRRDDDKKEGEK